jgi:hypothetical protein
MNAAFVTNPLSFGVDPLLYITSLYYGHFFLQSNFSYMAQQPLVGQDLLVFKITLRHTTLGITPLDE